MTSDDMKKESFITSLNTGFDETTAAWEMREGENDGYPVLKKVDTEITN